MNKNLLNQCQEIGSVPNLNATIQRRLFNAIAQTGKNFTDLTIAETLKLISDTTTAYNAEFKSDIDWDHVTLQEKY